MTILPVMVACILAQGTCQAWTPGTKYENKEQCMAWITETHKKADLPPPSAMPFEEDGRFVNVGCVEITDDMDNQAITQKSINELGPKKPGSPL